MSTITATVTTTITTIPLLRHRDTVVNFPADQDDFVAKYEATNDHLSVSTVPQINAVGDQIDIITGQINVVAGEINTNAGIATTQAGIATTQAGIATTQAGIAVAAVASLPVGTLNDSITTLTNAWSATKISGELATKLNLSGGNLTGALNTARATVASHATTADIWGALGNQIDFTGTATVTAFPNAPQAGAERTLICAGACSFTVGANMVIDGVPSGTVTCASGDTIIVRAISTTQFKLTRLKADGTAQTVTPITGLGSMVLLSSVIASNVATVDMETTFDATYDDYIIIADSITMANTTSLRATMKIGGVYDTSASYLYHYSSITSGSALYAATVGEAQTSLQFLDSLSLDAGNSAGITINIYKPLSTINTKILDFSTVRSNIGVPRALGGFGIGMNSSISAMTGIRFFAGTGNILTGNFRLYGIKKA